jgi:TolB-like protein
MRGSGDEVLRFARFEVDAARRQLRVDGKPVNLGARAFDVLLALARHRDRVASKAELLDAAWPGLAVEENNLKVQVVTLRKVLGATAIGTVSGRGYQLTAGPLLPAPSAALSSTPSTAVPRPGIAVMPFTNMSDDPMQEYFADGMVDDIITALARTGVVDVIARNSSFAFKGRAVDIRQVGIELGARYILEGGVRKAGGRIRINVQLLDASQGSHLWAERFDGALEDVFELQDRIGERVVAAVGLRVFHAESQRARRKPTSNLEAYDLKMRAGPKMDPGASPAERDEARALLLQALERDPAYTLAKATLANLHMQRVADGLGDVQDVRQGLRLAEEALADHRDEPYTLGLAGVAIALLGIRVLGITVAGFRYDEGLAAVDRALDMTPNLPMLQAGAGIVRLCMGEATTAIEYLERARRLHPVGFGTGTYSAGIAHAQFLAGRHAQALAEAERAIGESPGNTLAHRTKIIALGALARPVEARQATQELLTLAPRFTVARFIAVTPLQDARYRRHVAALFKRAGVPG